MKMWLVLLVLLPILGLLLFGLYSLIEARFRVLHDVPVDGMAAKARSKMPL